MSITIIIAVINITIIIVTLSLAINENWDPDVRDDMEMMLNRSFHKFNRWVHCRRDSDDTERENLLSPKCDAAAAAASSKSKSTSNYFQDRARGPSFPAFM